MRICGLSSSPSQSEESLNECAPLVAVTLKLVLPPASFSCGGISLMSDKSPRMISFCGLHLSCIMAREAARNIVGLTNVVSGSTLTLEKVHIPHTHPLYHTRSGSLSRRPINGDAGEGHLGCLPRIIPTIASGLVRGVCKGEEKEKTYHPNSRPVGKVGLAASTTCRGSCVRTFRTRWESILLDRFQSRSRSPHRSIHHPYTPGMWNTEPARSARQGMHMCQDG